MLSKKTNTRDLSNSMIIKAPNQRLSLRPLLKKIRQVLRSYQPQHWFEGFMDDVIIDLDDLEQLKLP